MSFDTLSADPELARLLTAEAHLGTDEEALKAQRRWIGRFGGLLDAAASDPRATPVEAAFLAPFLIGGARYQIARFVVNGRGSQLPRLLSEIFEALLARTGRS
jgi:hypothetical protein